MLLISDLFPSIEAVHDKAASLIEAVRRVWVIDRHERRGAALIPLCYAQKVQKSFTPDERVQGTECPFAYTRIRTSSVHRSAVHQIP